MIGSTAPVALLCAGGSYARPLRSRVEGRAWGTLCRDQQDLPRRLPCLERTVRVGRLGQRELVLETQLEFAVADPAQHVARALDELLASGDVVVEARPRHEQRTSRIQDPEVERSDRTAGLPVEHHDAPRTDAVESLVEGAGAHAVVVHVHARPAGEALDLGFEVRL